MKVYTFKLKIIILITIFLVGTVYVLSPFPSKDSTSLINNNKFYLPVYSNFELQIGNECAAYSVAFVLRNLGNESKGADIYAEIPFKDPFMGYVLTKGLFIYLQTQGLTPMIYKGDLATLKARLVQEASPIIVLIGEGIYWQHYITFLGFDDEKNELYFYDSNETNDNNAELPGNKTMEKEVFSNLWNNGLPVFNHVYISTGEKLVSPT
ncbi:hypothetical protein [Desulfosporosinus nitroreducens]|uniref:hypothetical protein n=1 Tax=Desulfosporosinus nitroreducens TaxID=2018668 RepID=UPI00207C9314|nr:hypothetical protein [Desulfosporosinus nitroreducens]MCO1602967.1 hypothetical protein [Desulfosporosinus nitroreducens]